MFCSICLMSGNTKPLVAKWPCCFKDILSIYIYMPTWHMNMVKIAITVLYNYWHNVISNWSRCIYSDILGSIRVIPDRQLNNNKVIHQLSAVNINSVQSSNASMAVHWITNNVISIDPFIISTHRGRVGRQSHIHEYMGVINHPCYNLTGYLALPLLISGHRWIFIFTTKTNIHILRESMAVVTYSYHNLVKIC